MSEKPDTARSYRATVLDDNAIVSINLKWLGQIAVLIGMLVYGYWQVESRIQSLENQMATADEKITELVKKHIKEEEIMDFMEIYGEAGMIGVVGAMFVYLVVSLSNKSAQQQETLEKLKVENRGQSETLENMEGMVIKLINRWNQSDDKLDRKFDAITKEINDLDNQVSELKGSMSRINGRH